MIFWSVVGVIAVGIVLYAVVGTLAKISSTLDAGWGE